MAQEEASPREHLTEPGDTWLAVALRYGIDETSLREANLHPNRQRQPAIGQVLTVPNASFHMQTGSIVSVSDGGLLQQAAVAGENPWHLANVNGLKHPYLPLLYRPIFLPDGDEPPSLYPPTMQSLEVSALPARPGQAIAVRGLSNKGAPSIVIHFAEQEMDVFRNGRRFVALGGTGAFLEPGEYALDVRIEGEPLWTQPWRVEPGEWTYEQITYTGAAAAIDAEAIREERERLAAIWNQSSASPLWSDGFSMPLTEFLQISSRYGARRSYSGGPYDRYHEGLDFSAYGGTPVFAPADGIVSLAEELVARGGAVIIDHGLGIFSGYYHLSEVLAVPDHPVSAGDLIGRVGSTGLSTGNHLHWDLLVGGTWIDPAAWLEQDMACWILEGWQAPCPDR